MTSALVVTARETLEATLLLGLVLAVLRRGGGRDFGTAVWAGAALALAASAVLAAVLLLALGGLGGTPQEASESALMWAAAGLLTYVLWWLRRHARELGGAIASGAERALAQHSRLAVAGVVFLAVAIFHALRIFQRWHAFIGGWIVPMWVSWAGVAVAGFLAFAAFGRKK